MAEAPEPMIAILFRGFIFKTCPCVCVAQGVHSRRHQGHTMANHAPIEAAEIQITRIFISSGHAYWTKGDEEPFGHAIQELTEVECMAGMGLRGDRHSVGKANRKGQVTFMSESAIEAIRNEFQLPHLPSSVFRRNIIVRGVELSALLNKRFEIQGVWFEGAQECKPCKWMDEVVAPEQRNSCNRDFEAG